MSQIQNKIKLHILLKTESKLLHKLRIHYILYQLQLQNTTRMRYHHRSVAAVHPNSKIGARSAEKQQHQKWS